MFYSENVFASSLFYIEDLATEEISKMASVDVQRQAEIIKFNQDAFRKAVKYILTEWPSLTLAIENGMGGSQAEEKREWMCSTVAEAMIKDRDLDLDDYLADMVNQEFDTLIEDGSLEYNTQWISKFYKDCLQGRGADVLEAINQASLKKISLGNVMIPKPVCQTQDTSSEDDDDVDIDEG